MDGKEKIKRYYVDGLDDRGMYERFIDYMVPISDAFCLVYFRYDYKEEYSDSVKEIRKKLEPYKKYERLAYEWPSTKTYNDQNHLYLYTLYKCDPALKDALMSVNGIYDWAYDMYPMDLCFFKNGYSFFFSSAHENLSVVCTSDEVILDELKKIGLQLEYFDKKNADDLFFDEVALKDYDLDNLPEKYKGDIDEICKNFSTTIVETNDYKFATDDNKFFAVSKTTGEEILIADRKDEVDYRRKSFFMSGKLFVALSNVDYSAFFSNAEGANSAGIWTIDVVSLEKEKIVEGDFSDIFSTSKESEIVAFDETAFYTIDIVMGKIVKEESFS